MATSQETELSRFEFKVQSKPNDTYYVLEIDGHEAISKPYEFRILFASADFNLQADDFLQQPAMLKIFTNDASDSTKYSGLIYEFALIKRVNNFVLYEAYLRPQLWKLSYNRITDIYGEEKSIPEIVAQKLSAFGLTSLNVEQRIKIPSDYRKRSFVCQFYETDLDFISRYMEAEGIYYFFDQSDSFSEKLVMVDYREGQPSDKKTLYYFDVEDMPTDMQGDRVTRLSTRQRVVQAKTVVQDFNFRKASLEDSLKSEKTIDAKGLGTCMFWGYNLRQVDEATRMATVRSEELLCDQSLISGVSSAINVRSGYTIKLEQHYQTEVNKDYLVTSVRHRGHQTYAWFESEENSADSSFQGGTFYDCSFTAIDEKKQFRARRETPWPHISGTLNAIIDDEGSGKYAQLNDYGQYKVQLLFDLTSKNTNRGSSWIRMASPYAGRDHGMAFPLLKGTEVIIGFMGGDPDQPIILGAVPNSENPNVLNASNAHLGGFQSSSGNYMIVNDMEGQESVHMWSPNGNTHFYIGNF